MPYKRLSKQSYQCKIADRRVRGSKGGSKRERCYLEKGPSERQIKKKKPLVHISFPDFICKYYYHDTSKLNILFLQIEQQFLCNRKFKTYSDRTLNS